jgi:hypothetical protein
VSAAVEIHLPELEHMKPKGYLKKEVESVKHAVPAYRYWNG